MKLILKICSSFILLAIGFGCKSLQRVHPTETAGADSSMAIITAYTKIPLLYVTDRKRTGSNSIKDFYGNNRNESMEHGKVIITIPSIHEEGEIEKPSWWQIFETDDPNSFFTVTSLEVLSKKNFYESLSGKTNINEEALIFIHGYRNTFEDALFRTAQLTYDLGFKGVAITYSWPSKGNLENYLSDEDNVNWTIPHLKEFLKEIALRSKLKRINIIAHSMGNRALTLALKELRYENPLVVFNQIILASPDIDRDIFVQSIAPVIQTRAKRFTIYTSNKDRALLASQRIHSNIRVGNSATTIDGFQTVDVSSVDCGDFLDHACFATSQLIIDDIFKLINYDIEPDRRNLLKVGTYWVIRK